MLDVRSSRDYAKGSVPKSLNIGLDGQFASWAGTLVDPNRDLVIVAEDETGAAQARTRLARVGLRGWPAGSPGASPNGRRPASRWTPRSR